MFSIIKDLFQHHEQHDDIVLPEHEVLLAYPEPGCCNRRWYLSGI